MPGERVVFQGFEVREANMGLERVGEADARELRGFRCEANIGATERAIINVIVIFIIRDGYGGLVRGDGLCERE